ncbi:MAG TPA: nuclear transport factor 2 family protein [Steroidobacteraceae bacterium]|nr:nuclear transport factor 2 family protein [Steroidobacteraceae bacterium]
MQSRFPGLVMIAISFFAPVLFAADAPKTDAETVAALDTAYQAAVEKNDWQGMDRILHPDFKLILAKGKVISRDELLEWAREPEAIYEQQVEMPGTRTVRVFGPNTATVTAMLWLKGRFTKDKNPFEYKLWFTDTYVKTPDGWKFALSQASEHLKEQPTQ